MNIPKISLALCAVAVAGCGSKSATTDAPKAPETVGNPLTMTTTPPEIAANSAIPPTPSAEPTAMSNDKMSGMKMDSANPKGGATIYHVRGQVVSITPAGAGGPASIMLKHEEIPGFMKAMQMQMPLANVAGASNVKAGDKIAFDLKKGNLEVFNIKVLPPSTALKLAR